MSRLTRTATFAALGLVAATVVGSLAFAQSERDRKPSAPPSGTSPGKPAGTSAPAGGAADFPLPPGWTAADMEACVAAGTPGAMQKHLTDGVGVWHGATTMWMGPGGPPTESTCTLTTTSMMDGRYVRSEMEGEMPGMGAFEGFGIYAFDNVSQKFQMNWIDNQSTGIMTGTGELSSDGKTMSWTCSFSCPVTTRPTVLREIERITGPDSRTLEMFGTDPKSGKEWKMMEIKLTRKKG